MHSVKNKFRNSFFRVLCVLYVKCVTISLEFYFIINGQYKTVGLRKLDYQCRVNESRVRTSVKSNRLNDHDSSGVEDPSRKWSHGTRPAQ